MTLFKYSTARFDALYVDVSVSSNNESQRSKKIKIQLIFDCHIHIQLNMFHNLNSACKGNKKIEIEFSLGEALGRHGVSAVGINRQRVLWAERGAGAADRGDWRTAGLKRFTVGCARVTRLTNTARARRSTLWNCTHAEQSFINYYFCCRNDHFYRQFSLMDLLYTI